MNTMRITIAVVSFFLLMPFSNGQEEPTPEEFEKNKALFSASGGQGTCQMEPDLAYLLLLDATDPLDPAQTQYVLDNYVNDWRFKEGDRFTVMVLSDEPVETTHFYSFCAPKHIDDASWITDPLAKIRFLNTIFKQTMRYAVTDLAESHTEEADASLLIEVLAQVYTNARYHFKTAETRKLVLVSDLFQNSDTLSFYSLCKTPDPPLSGLMECPSFDETLADLAVAQNIKLATSKFKLDSGDSVEIYYRNVGGKIDASAEPWWRGYFLSVGLPEDNIEFSYQL